MKNFENTFLKQSLHIGTAEHVQNDLGVCPKSITLVFENENYFCQTILNRGSKFWTHLPLIKSEKELFFEKMKKKLKKLFFEEKKMNNHFISLVLSQLYLSRVSVVLHCGFIKL